MRLLTFLGLCLFLNSCNTGDSYQRSYVISKSHETAADTEAINEPPSE